MMNNMMVDFNSIYDEILKHHLGPQHYPIDDKLEFYKTDKISFSATVSIKVLFIFLCKIKVIPVASFFF